MAYVLGTDADEPTFARDGIHYAPAGRRHAVDTASPQYNPESELAYAVCGQAVRAWKDQPFEAEVIPDQMHEDCLAYVRQH